MVQAVQVVNDEIEAIMFDQDILTHQQVDEVCDEFEETIEVTQFEEFDEFDQQILFLEVQFIIVDDEEEQG